MNTSEKEFLSVINICNQSLVESGDFLKSFGDKNLQSLDEAERKDIQDRFIKLGGETRKKLFDLTVVNAEINRFKERQIRLGELNQIVTTSQTDIDNQIKSNQVTSVVKGLLNELQLIKAELFNGEVRLVKEFSEDSDIKGGVKDFFLFRNVLMQETKQLNEFSSALTMQKISDEEKKSKSLEKVKELTKKTVEVLNDLKLTTKEAKELRQKQLLLIEKKEELMLKSDEIEAEAKSSNFTDKNKKFMKEYSELAEDVAKLQFAFIDKLVK